MLCRVLSLLLTVGMSIGAISSATTAKAEPPKVKVKEVRKVYGNGTHNAFTDLCKYQGNFYLTFRNCPDGHGVNPTSKIIVLSSPDAREWKEVFTFSVLDRDTRDPHFAVLGDKLFVYSGTWDCKPDLPNKFDVLEHLGYGVWTENGTDWQGPYMLEGTYGHYIWRAAEHNGKMYLCGRRNKHFVKTETRAERDQVTESALLVSDDGLVFKTQGLFQPIYGNETAFLFEDNGDILAVARCGGGKYSQVCRAQAPYTEFSQTDLDRHIGGPMLDKWNDLYVSGGRLGTNKGPVTALYWLVGNDLVQFAELPSGGDNSYPGFYQLDKTHALVSYYSSHEPKTAEGKQPTSVYLAELELESP